MVDFLSGQRELTVNQLRKLRGFESLIYHPLPSYPNGRGSRLKIDTV